MNIKQCIVLSLMQALKAIDLDKLGALCFIVDYLGGFEAFSWTMEGGSPISADFIDTVEELAGKGLLKIKGSSIALSNEQPQMECGWMNDKVKSTVNGVLARYAHMSLEELINEAAFLYQDQP